MIVFATCNRFPDPTPSLDLLLKALQADGVDAGFHPWNHADQRPFGAADIVLPICCWDYQPEVARFRAWIDGLDAAGVALLNPAPLLRWNLRKTYLLDLAASGLAVPRSFQLASATPEAIEAHLRRQGWQSAVLKPVSGQGGAGVLKLDLADRAGWDLGEQLGAEALLQAVHPEIAALGEITLVFVDGEFSHAVQRRLQPGEWRANHQYGVSVEAASVDAGLIATARRYLDAAPSLPFYARVDGLARPDRFLLMELEAVEPYFYFELVPGTAERFAAALKRRLR
ncbi:ATP-grasp domain-containing protein [Desertibaculum subflavum]|uniref:ATP-grasp domain-containing protein n=1 Tax=Desertibaculum subflavum TaxID=2268458 RepID=UPI0013C517B0